MVELTWQGKYTPDGQRAAPLRVQLPFQTVETVNESAQQRQMALDLFSAGRPAEWRNRLIWGDKKYVLPALLGECKWGDHPVGRAVVVELIKEKSGRVLQRLPDNGKGWTVHYVFFARAGFTDAARAEAEMVGAQLVDLATLDTDLTHSVSLLGTRVDLEHRAQRWAEAHRREPKVEVRQLGLWENEK